jgi:hypothetical protein
MTLFAVGTAVVVLTSGCGLFGSGGSTVVLAASPKTPSSQGEVKTKTTSDKNTRVTVTVKHLAPPEKIEQGATTYVVWVRPLGVSADQGERSGAYPERQEGAGRNEAGVYNLGALKIGKNLDGELVTITPFKSFEIFVTAEASGAITQPHGERILWTSISKN